MNFKDKLNNYIDLIGITSKDLSKNDYNVYYYVKGTEPGVNKEQYVIKEENSKEV